MRVPSLTKREYRPRRYLVNNQVYARSRDVMVVADTVSPVGLAHRIREGTVLVRLRNDAHFVVATDPRADTSGPAELASLVPADASWANTSLTLSLSPGLGFSIVLPASIQDTAGVVDELNRHAGFRGHFLADENARGHLRIRTLAGGPDAFAHVVSTLPAAFGRQGIARIGREPEVVVADDLGELKDIEGKPIPAVVPALSVGHFRTSELIALTPDAKRVLTRRGSLFA